MSVINKMLRDLEGQQTQAGKGKNYHSQAGTKARVPAWRFALLFLLLVAAIIWSWLTFTGDPVAIPPTEAPEFSVPPPTAQGAENQIAQVAADDTDAVPTNMNSGILLMDKNGSPISLEKSVGAVSVSESETMAKSPATVEELVALADGNPSVVPVQDERAPFAADELEAAADTSESDTKDMAASRFVDNGDGPVIQFSRKNHASNTSATPQTQPENVVTAPATMKVSKAPPWAVEETLRNEIAKAMKSGDNSEAIRLLTQLSQREPDNISVRKKLASVMFAQGQTDKAQQLLEQTLLNVPANTSVRLMLSRLYAQQNMNALAWEVIREPEQSADADFLGFRAGFAQQQQRTESAMIDYRALVVLQPGQARWWLGLGVTADQLNRNHLAVQAYQKALRLQGLEEDVEAFIRQRISALSE